MSRSILMVFCILACAALAYGYDAPLSARTPLNVSAAANPLVAPPTICGTDDTDSLIFFENFESDTGLSMPWQTVDLTAEATWHKDSSYACGGSGMSWWVGNPGLPGYDNNWLQYLESPTLDLSMAVDPVLEFDVLWSVEGVEGPFPSGYNGWDGCNVWVSTNNGQTWSVVPMDTPAYTTTSLASFGIRWGMGPNIPGWTGFVGNNWQHATTDMSAYVSSQVKLRFALASDEEICSRDADSLIGYLVDNINLHDQTMTFLENNAEGVALPREMSSVSGMGLVGNFWHLEEANSPPPPSPDSVMRMSNQSGSYGPSIINALVSPRISLSSYSADSTRIFADFYIRGSINVDDPDAWPYMDFWTVQVSPNDGATWYYYSNPWDQASGSNIVWIGVSSNYTKFSQADGEMIDLTSYAGWDVLIRILFQSDEDGLSGSGLFVDNFWVETQAVPSQDIAAEQLWIPMPTSTYFSTLDRSMEVSNQGMSTQTNVPISISINNGAPQPVGTVPLLVPNQTTTFDFDWTGFSQGSYAVKAFYAGVDSNAANDTSNAGVVVITSSNVLEFGYDNRQYSYLPSYSYFEVGEGAGACVRFTPQADGVDEDLDASQLKAMFNSTGPVRVHIFQSGTETEPGAEAESFEAQVTTIYPGWQVFDLTGVEYLQANLTDFWVWLEVTDSANDPQIIGSHSVHGDGHFFMHNGAAFIPSAYDFFVRAVMQPSTAVRAVDPEVLPQRFALEQNNPNPFNPVTVIPYALPRAAQVKLAIFDTSGRMVATLVDGWQAAGSYQATFDAGELSSGLYVYRLTAGDFTDSGKMVLLK